MNNNKTTHITQLNKTRISQRKGGYNPKYSHRKSTYYRKTPSWLLCKQRLINVRGLYLKHVYSNLHRVIIYKYMHVILMWWYILSHRYLQLTHQLHYTVVWCSYYVISSNSLQYSSNANYNYKVGSIINSYKWAIPSPKRKKRGLYLRKRTRKGGFFRIRRNPVSYGRYLPPKQYALIKAFYSPSNRVAWEDKFTLPLNIIKVRRIITQPRKGWSRKLYIFINFTAFTVRERSKTYLYYTNIKQQVTPS